MPADVRPQHAGPAAGARLDAGLDARLHADLDGPPGRDNGGEANEPLAAWLAGAVQQYPARFAPAKGRHRCCERTHSRLADGRLLCWRPPAPPTPTGLVRAIDAELAGQTVPRALARRATTDDPDVFWPLWTRAEVRAKLHGIPIAAWLKRVDWAADDDLGPVAGVVTVITVVADGAVVSYGVRERRGATIT